MFRNDWEGDDCGNFEKSVFQCAEFRVQNSVTLGKLLIRDFIDWAITLSVNVFEQSVVFLQSYIKLFIYTFLHQYSS